MIPPVKTITAIIIDDEEDACNNLCNILSEFINVPVQVLAVAMDTLTAETLIRHHQPDAIFLDIDMPVESGFDFLKRMHPFSFEAIFVTAYDEYAIKAFRLNAIDYILKPVNILELNNAVQKLQERCQLKKLADSLHSSRFRTLPEQISHRVSPGIILRDGNEITPVDFKDLLYIEAKGSYSKIVFWKGNVEKTVTMGYPLAEYEELLPAGQFYRIHKSYLINCIQIHRLLKDEHPSVVLKNKAKLQVGRRRFQEFLAFIQTNSYLM